MNYYHGKIFLVVVVVVVVVVVPRPGRCGYGSSVGSPPLLVASGGKEALLFQLEKKRQGFIITSVSIITDPAN